MNVYSNNNLASKIHSIWNSLIHFYKFLRCNHPFLWYSKVHLFILISLLIVNPLLWILATNYQLNIGNVPNIDSLINLVNLIRFICALIIIYWISNLIKSNLKERLLVYYIKSWGVYSFCIFLLYINSIIFLQPIISKTASLVEDVEFQDCYEFHSNYNFWHCESDLNFELFENHKEQINNDLLKYKIIDGSFSLSLINEVDFLPICENSEMSLIAMDFNTEKKPLLVGLDLRKKLESISEAKKFNKGVRNVYSNYFSWWKFIVYSLLLGALVLILTLPRSIITRNWFKEISFISKIKPRINYTKYIDKIDNYFLIHYPLLWSTKFHSYFLHSLVVTFIFLVVLVILGEIFNVELFNSNFLSNVLAESEVLSTIIIFIIIFLGASWWGYFQTRKKYIPLKFHENLFLIFIYLILVNLIPFFITPILTIIWNN